MTPKFPSGQETWFSSERNLLLLPKARTHTGATEICNSNSSVCGTLFWAPWALDTYSAHTYIPLLYPTPGLPGDGTLESQGLSQARQA